MSLSLNPTTGRFELVTNPGGTNEQIQFNNNGVFGGIGSWNGSTFTIPGGADFTSAAYPVIRGTRTSTGTNGYLSAIAVRHVTTNDMADGFGANFSFVIQDSAGVDNILGAIGAYRYGADNSGMVVLSTRSLGTQVDHVFIDPAGRVGIGVGSPAYKLDVKGIIRAYDSTATTGISQIIVRNGAGQGTNPQISIQDASGNTAWASAYSSSAITAYANFRTDTGGNLVLNSKTGNALFLQRDTGSDVYLQGDMRIGSAKIIKWANATDPYGAVNDIGLSRGEAGKLYLGNGTASSYSATLTLTNLEVLSDAGKAMFGAGLDMSVYYNGTIGIIKTNDVAASDLQISCGTDKTLILEETVYNDIQYAISTGKVPASSSPTWATWNTDFAEFSFEVNDYIDLGSQELKHDGKEGTAVEFHIHWSTGSGNYVNGDKVKWQLQLSWANMASSQPFTVFSATTTLTVEQSFTTTVAPFSHVYSSFGAFTPTGWKIGAQVKVRLKRIAKSAGGTDPGSAPFGMQVGLHYEIDTMGSRSLGGK